MGDRKRSIVEDRDGPHSIMKKESESRRLGRRETKKSSSAIMSSKEDNEDNVSKKSSSEHRRSSTVGGRMSPDVSRSYSNENRRYMSRSIAGSWETDWNQAAGKQRSGSKSVGSTYIPQRNSRPSFGPRVWSTMPTVQMEAGKAARTEVTKPEELLRWTTEARVRDVNRQQLLDERKKLQMDDYDPDIHRDDILLISDREALAITSNVIVGAAFVGLPMAYVQSGLLVGSIGVFVVSVCVSYCMHILLYWRYEVLKELRKPWVGYPRVMQVAASHGPAIVSKFGVALKVVVHILFIPYLIFATAVQCVFEADALRMIMDYYGEHRDLNFHLALMIVAFLPLSVMPNMRILAFVSIFGVLCSFSACFLISVAVVIARRDYILTGELVDAKFDSPLYLLVTLSTLQPVAQLMCVESHMKNRKNFLGYFGVLNRTLIAVTCVYLLLASIAYAKFANDTQDNILYNLKFGKLEVVSSIIFIISVLLTFPISIYTVYDFAWEVLLRHRLRGFPQIEKVLWGYGVRICIAILTILISFVIIGFIDKTHFIMAFCLPLLILVFPPLIELNMGYKRTEYGPKGYKFWIDVAIIVFGLTTLVLTLRAYILMDS